MANYPQVWSWPLGTVQLTVRHGSLLEAEEQAWVNSEQTDFVLASDGPSVSAQLGRAWPAAQSELDALTQHRVLPPGTVLETSGPRGRRLYHAGFHEPHIWLLDDDDVATVHLEHIQSCIEQILERAGARGLRSIAFPLIGTGVFGLPVERFSAVFFDAVGRYAMRAERPMKVALCVWHREDLGTVVHAGTRALAALVTGGDPILQGIGGHPLLEQLRDEVRASAHADVEVRSMLRFAELALAVDLACLAEHAALGPPSVLQPCARGRGGCKLTFGLVRDRLAWVCATARDLPKHLHTRRRFLRQQQARACIGRLVSDRNAYAHHRATRDSSSVRDDIDALFGEKALPQQWPHRDGRWMRRTKDGSHALLYGVDFVRGLETWFAPLTRQYWEESSPRST